MSNIKNKQPKEFFVNLINFLFLLFFFLIFIYSIYKSEFQILNTNNRFFYNNLLLIFLLIFHTIIIFIKFINFKTNLTIVAISFYFSVFLIEIMASFYLAYYNNLGAAEELNYKIAEEQNITYDKRSFIEVYDDEIKKNKDIVMSMVPAYFKDEKFTNEEIYPLGGISNSLTLHCNESGSYSTYFSDRFGFNNPDYVWDQKADVILVGDSFTHGACVDGGYDIASNLRNLIPKKNFINLGMGSNDTFLLYSSVKEYGTKLKPKIILWMHFENDIVEMDTWGKNNEIALKYFHEDLNQSLFDNQKQIDKKLINIIKNKYNKLKLNEKNKLPSVNNKIPKKSLIEITNLMRNIILLRNLRTIMGFNNIVEYNPLFLDILTKAKNEINANDGKLIFVYLPSWERYKFKFINKSKLYQKDKILSEMKKISVPVIDLDELYFNKHLDPLSLFPFRNRNHYTIEGYKNVANIIADQLTELN